MTPEANPLQVLLFGFAFVAACVALSWLARRHWHRKRASKPNIREDLEAALEGLLQARLDYLRCLARAEALESEARSQRIRSEEAKGRIERLKDYLSRESSQHIAEVLAEHGEAEA